MARGSPAARRTRVSRQASSESARIGARPDEEIIEQPARALRHTLEGKRALPSLSVTLVVSGLIEQHAGFSISEGQVEGLACFLAEPRRLPVRLAQRRNSDGGSSAKTLAYSRGDFTDASPCRAPPLLLLASPRDVRHQVNRVISQRCDQRLRQCQRKVCSGALKAPSFEQSSHRIISSRGVGLDGRRDHQVRHAFKAHFLGFCRKEAAPRPGARGFFVQQGSGPPFPYAQRAREPLVAQLFEPSDQGVLVALIGERLSEDLEKLPISGQSIGLEHFELEQSLGETQELVVQRLRIATEQRLPLLRDELRGRLL